MNTSVGPPCFIAGNPVVRPFGPLTGLKLTNQSGPVSFFLALGTGYISPKTVAQQKNNADSYWRRVK